MTPAKLSAAATKLFKYKAIPAERFWQPKPGEPFQLQTLTPYTPLTLQTFTAYTPVARDVYAALEERMLMTMTEWNTPHVCNHEGPWTLHSCGECDIREAKIVVALIAWLMGRQDILDLMKPRWVHCMHPGASLYEQCRTCRNHIRQMADAGHDFSDLGGLAAKMRKMLPYLRDPGRVEIERLRDDAKRVSFAAAIGPYGGL